MSPRKPSLKRSSKRRKSKGSKGSFLSLKRLMIFMSVALVLGGGIVTYWFFSSGRATRLIAKTNYRFIKHISAIGFTVQQVIVDGRVRTKRKVLFDKLGIKKGQFIYGIDLKETLERLNKLMWVQSARIERRLPDTLFVKIIEKHPVAFWQNKKKHYLVDTYGKVIGRFPLKDYPGYIVATGEGAAEKLPWLVQKIGNYESVYAKTTGAVFVSKRRWNLILNNIITVQLPEDDIDEALERIIELDKENRLSSPDIDTIDLRSKGKVYFYLSKEGLKRRKSARGKAA